MPPQGQRDLSGYQYSALSSLVLSSGRRPGENEPTGEAETLVGRIDPKAMGSRVARQSVTDLEKKKRKAAEHDELSLHQRGKQKARTENQYANVLQASAELDGLRYRPRTEETRNVYELILALIHSALGDQASEVIRSAADTALEILKDDNLKDLDRKREIEAILGAAMSEESFAQLTNLGKRITDYEEERETQEGAEIDDETGVAVLFENEDEESESEETFVVRDADDDDDDDDENNDQTNQARDSDAENSDNDSNFDANANEDGNALHLGTESSRQDSLVDPHEVDAYWLQRQVGAYYPDVVEATQKADETLAILGDDTDLRTCENALMDLYNYTHFDLVQLLTKNREVVVWCTRLARAGADDDKRIDVEVAMRERNLHAILKTLAGDKNANQDLEKAKLNAQRITSRATLAPGSTAQPRNTLDLESMAFSQGGHLNTNTKVRLPPGSFKRSKKGYEEIHIPAPDKKTVPASDLVPIKALPEWAQPAFPGATSLNAVQSKCYPVAFHSDEPMLLCAPTGAGKTNVAMLTILHEMGKYRNEQGSFDLNAFKIVYVAPMKALVAEQAANFRDRLAAFGVQVNELTGDTQLTKAQIAETQVIVTTPEKWDVVSRKSTDASYTNLVRLVIIDEIHLLHDDRGPVLEAIVARTIRRMEQLGDPVRIVGLSATLPNYRDVATFLRVNPESGLLYFEANYRPCPLRQEYVGITESKAIKRLQLLNEITYDKTLEHAGKNQLLIFTHSRKETAKTAKYIRDRAMEQETLGQFLPQSTASREILQTELENVQDANLKDVLPYGFGIHHAGMNRADRQLVEDLFADGHIQVLVSTATLAWGVNLPAHTVIIKGTQIYNPEKSRWCELSPQDMLQMLGRAGRPQFDTVGEGIILTTHNELQYYLSLLNQQLPIESQLVSRLADNMNAEIVLGTIRNRDEAVAWLGYTYLYTPALYSVSPTFVEDDPFLEQKRADIVHSAALLLEKAGLLRYDRRSGLFTSNELARIAAHYYLTHTSMTTYHRHIKSQVGIIDLLRVFALSDEFKFQVVRQDEKLEVSKLLERVPIPVKETLDEPSAKVNVLLQSYISQLSLDGYALAADMVYITQSAGRILRALVEICIVRGYARVARLALDLAKMVEHRQWNSMTPLRQFHGVPGDLIRRLERKEFPFSRLRDLDPNEVGELIGIPKAGRLVHRLVTQFPRLELAAYFQPLTPSMLQVNLAITPDFQWDERVHQNAQSFWLLVEDVDGEQILFYDQFVLLRKYAEEEHTVSFTVPLTDPLPPNYFVSLISDRWLQSEARLPISFKNLVLPDKFAPPTPLLELQPQPTAALGQDLACNYEFTTLNPIQTQTFHALYQTDQSVLVCAPPGTGKGVCLEMALARHWQQESNSESSRAVCLVPFQSMVAPRVTQWQKRFNKHNIAALTSDVTTNLQLLQSAELVVTTPEQWDVLSRRWRQRKLVQSVSLYLLQDLQLLSDEHFGPVYEVVCSRIRFIAAQLESKCRIVGAAACLANALDVGHWLGVERENCFHFAPSARVVPMEVHLQTFTIPHFASLMIAMAKPAYLAITEYAPSQPVLVFVPSRKQSMLTANDLLMYAQADSDPDAMPPFLNIDAEHLAPHLAKIQDEELRACVSQGVAFYHQGLAREDRRIVQRLFDAGAIQVLVASKDTVWTLECRAHLVLLLSLQTYEGKEHRYIDYPLTDMVEMVGKCTVPGDQGNARCMLFCQANRKEYFKKFLAEGLPLESQLHTHTQDFLNAEIVAHTVQDKQAAVDILTWTLMYRRLQKNPQAYGCLGRDMQNIADFLSELVESSLQELEQSKCIAIEDDSDVSALNLGMIASYYNVACATMDVFQLSLSGTTKLRGMLEILSAATEFDTIPIRHHEDALLRRIYDRVPLKLDKINYTSPYHKTFILLQAHFSRLRLPADLAQDQQVILHKVLTLLNACVDVMSSGAFLNAIVAMELSHMCVQAVWDRDSPLRQVPHFSSDTIQRCQAKGIDDVYALSDALPDMSVSERDELLQMSKRQLADVAQFTNEFPYIEVSFDIDQIDELDSVTPILLRAKLQRDIDEEDPDPSPTAIAPYFPTSKVASWWLVVGDPGSKALLSIKRVTLSRSLDVKLEFTLPPGTHDRLKLYLMSDSYVGADRELQIQPLTVAEGIEEDEDEDDEDLHNE
ncbi:RNA helicase [Malassezia psittaci]|uniref:RNA helicase n=1 Tax=Malassezia psittaci TaxID=1821823 RepID=A0AAF0JEH3_9BASI|nr:RNA helicase [Malassezia psittaci]